jgi:hypothetical protein
LAIQSKENGQFICWAQHKATTNNIIAALPLWLNGIIMPYKRLLLSREKAAITATCNCKGIWDYANSRKYAIREN